MMARISEVSCFKANAQEIKMSRFRDLIENFCSFLFSVTIEQVCQQFCPQRSLRTIQGQFITVRNINKKRMILEDVTMLTRFSSSLFIAHSLFLPSLLARS